MDVEQPFRNEPVKSNTHSLRGLGGGVIALLALMCAGCPHDVHARMPTERTEPTGSVTILLTRPASDLTVSVNGTLVANRVRTKKVVVAAVPIGTADVVIAAGAGAQKVERHVRVDVEEDKQHTIPLASPERSWLATVAAAVLSVGAWFASQALYLAVF